MQTVETKSTTNENPYTDLKDINEVTPLDPIKDKALFRELHEVLMKHDAAGRFGVTLLHDHFPVNDGEVMIETHNHETRELTIKPYRNPELKESEVLQETNWKFGENGETIALLQCIALPTGHVSNW